MFRGDTSHWQIHLQAAITVSLQYRRERVKVCGPSTQTLKLAMEFCKGVLTWYDILSCASTGLKPFSDFEHIDEEIFSVIRFDKLMGCENWVMRLIMEIATLGEWKRRLEANSDLGMWQIMRRAAEIEMRLEKGLTASPLPTGTKPQDKTSSGTTENLARVITHIFGSAALVYLHVIISGADPEIPEIHKSVSQTMTALNVLKNKDLVRNLQWPICIAGSMATMGQESFWRDLVCSVSRERWTFGYSNEVLEVMEEAWRLRKSQPGTSINWMTAMKSLDIKVLLV